MKQALVSLGARLARNLAMMTAFVSVATCGPQDGIVVPSNLAAGEADLSTVATPSTATVTFVSATSQQTSGSSIAFDRPPGLQAGDVMIAQVSTEGATRVSQAPSGWTLIRGDYTGTYSNSYLFWRRAGASEPTSFVWGLSASTRAAGGIAAYRNVIASGNPVEAHGGRHTAASTSIVAPSITTKTDAARLIATFSAASEPKETSLVFTAPQGTTRHYTLSSQIKGNHRNVVAMHASTAAGPAGATGVRTATLNAARHGWGQLIALTPAPAASAPPGNRAPMAVAGGPYSGPEGSAIVFDGTGSSDPDGDSLTYRWSFGDGRTAAVAEPSHTYVDNGSFSVVLTVTDIHGASNQSTTTATITNAAPVVTLGLPSSAGVGQVVTATMTFRDPGTSDTPWRWEVDWGNGTKSNGSATSQSDPVSAQHTYASAGTYAVRASITDKDDGTGTAQQTLTVTDGTQPDTWYTDFREYTTGQAPTGWSQPYATSGYRVVEVAGSTGGKVLQNTITGLDHYALQWDAVGTQTDLELETVARVTSGRNGTMGLLARGTAGRSFYSNRLDEGKNQWIIARYNNGSSRYLTHWNNPFPVGTWVRQRFRVEGNTLRVKIWAASSPEPAAWTMQAVDPSPLGSGFAGVWMRYGTTTNEFDWVRVTRIADPSSPVTPPTAVEWAWSGAQSAGGAMVRVRLSAASTEARLRFSTDSLFRTYSETTPVTTGGNNVATFTLTGLAANTRYHYQPVSGTTAYPTLQGGFRTLPVAGTNHSFTFALGACQRTVSTSTIFDHIRATAPLFWLQTGDIHYRDIAVNDIDQFRQAYNALHDYGPQAALFRSTALVHVWDDHDGAGGNDTDATKTGWPAVKAAYRETVPHHVLPAGPQGAIFHSFVVGRVRFIVSDLRSERSPKGQLDDERKTMLGAAQKEHFKTELAAAKANGQFIAWVISVPWIAAPTAGADHWGGYDTERREIAAYINQLGVSGRMFGLLGDMHATAIDTGVNNAWGGFPIFHAAPIDQTSSTKGGPYSHGPFTGGTTGQFGVVSVEDTGGSTIRVTFTGRRGADAITGATYTFERILN